ncbi:MAG TPA: hypothetical protein VES62_17850 [Thermoleophilaceae bacterium]|nr:hypothetical protein [Thermoleophilaceae bacterium]
MPEAAQLFFSAVIGALAGAFAAAYKSRKELESLYDIELRRRRIDAYVQLWKLLEPLARWSPPRPLTYHSLAQLSRALRSWYFSSGGLFLSRTTRAPYFNLQEALTRLGERAPADKNAQPEVDTVKILRALASRLRTFSTEDVATRVDPSMAGSFLARVRRLIGARRSPLRIEVDRRWDFEQAPPQAAYYVVLENTANRVLDVESIHLGDGGAGAGRRMEEEKFLLQPAEEREVKSVAQDEDAAAGRIPTVTVTLAGGRTVDSRETPDVPLPTPVLDLRGPRSTTSADS